MAKSFLFLGNVEKKERKVVMNFATTTIKFRRNYMNNLNGTANHANFKQLTSTDRITIEVLLKQGISITEIAKQLGKHRSSIYREIKRGSITTLDSQLQQITKYEAKTAQSQSDKRNLNSKKKPKSEQLGRRA